MRIPLIAGILGSLLLAASPGVAHAHADAVSSVPRQGSVLTKAPTSIVIRFSEAVTLDSPAPVIATGSRTIASTPTLQGRVLTVHPTQPLGAGITTVTWHVISDDGHPVSGVLAFQVGAPGARGPRQRVATTPSVPAVLSGSRAGRLTLTFGKEGSSGDVEWTSPQYDGPITWRIAPGSHSASGVLPSAGTWHMTATLQSPTYAVVIVNGEAAIRG